MPPSLPDEMRDARFRIAICQRAGWVWEFTVWDIADHGPDLIYAQGTAGSIEGCLDLMAPYVLAAAGPDPLLQETERENR